MAYSDEVLADAPLAYWQLEEASGTTLVDSTANARNGTWTGTPGFGATGLVASEGVSVTFSGDDYASIPNGAWMFPATWTYEAVVNVSAIPSGWVDVICQGNDLDLCINSDGSVQCYVDIGGVSLDVLGGSAPIGATRHLAVTYDGASLKLYVDGTSVATTAATGTRTTTTNPLLIGRWPTQASAGWFQGRMGHVAMHDTALAPARIAARAAAMGATPPAPIDTAITYANDGYNYGGGVSEVDFDPPIAISPARIRPTVIRRVHQSIPTPTLVDGRPV